MKHAVHAAGEFLGGYMKVFKEAWSVRDALDPPRRTEDEIAFLPAHLELTDTPVSPMTRWIMRTIIAFFCLALLWAIFGQMDIVAVASGKTVIGSRTKVLQSAETAVITGIFVHNGQRVKQGDVLIELDATGTAADVEKSSEALVTARLAEMRFKAVSASLHSGINPMLQPGSGLPLAQLAAEQRLAESQFQTYQANKRKLTAAIAQREAEVETVRASIEPLAESAKIATTRARDYAELLEGQYVGRHDYLLREQERIAAERDLAAQRSRLVESLSALSVSREELRGMSTAIQQEMLDGLRQATDQRSQFAPEVTKTLQRNRQMLLRAPVSGTVQQLVLHTVGGVVTPAQPLLAVVPVEEALEVEATVLNKDIGFVRAGQRATIKVESFPYTRYGYLEGIVESVSPDAAQDEKLGLIFPATLKLNGSTLMVEGAKVRLTPGMNLSVEIKTGKRSIISYLISPLRQHANESFKER